MARLIAFVFVAFACTAPFTPAQKPKDAAKQEQAAQEARKSLQAARRNASELYNTLETATFRAREVQGGPWLTACGAAFDATAAAVREALAKAGTNKTAAKTAIAAAVKGLAPAACKRLEDPALQTLEPYLTARLVDAASNLDPTAPPADGKTLAALALGDLLGTRPFFDIWNESLAAALPALETFRKANAAAETARWDLDVANDPTLVFQRNAPAGFARVPSGGTTMLGTSGFGPNGPRKGKKQANVPKDFFLCVREVTAGDYFIWWKTLDAGGQKKHVPRDAGGKSLWVGPGGDPLPELAAEPALRPVTGVTFASAVEYARSKGARLPTEAEWCLAAGGSSGKMYPWGDAWLADRANDAERKAGDTMPVGSFPEGRGPFGHLDLAGNAAELLATYENGKDVDQSKIEDLNVVVRGGSYLGGRTEVSTGWVWYRRALFDQSVETGFRLAMDAAATSKR